MSVSNDVMHNWIDFLTTKLYQKAMKIMKENNRLDLLAVARMRTKSNIIGELGIESLQHDYNELQEEIKEAERHLAELKAVSQQKYNSIRALVEGPHHAAVTKSHRTDVTGMIDEMVEARLIDVLLEGDLVMYQVGKLMKASSQIEFQLMLATTPTQVKNFALEFCKQFDIDLDLHN